MVPMRPRSNMHAPGQAVASSRVYASTTVGGSKGCSVAQAFGTWEGVSLPEILLCGMVAADEYLVFESKASEAVISGLDWGNVYLGTAGTEAFEGER